MNDIMKMIRFDLISVSRLTVPYVAIFAVVCIIAAFFSIPIGIFCVVKLVAPRTITRSEGKAKRVINKRNLYQG